MQKFFIEASKHSPQIIVDFEKSLVQISGRSYPENGIHFYKEPKNMIKLLVDSNKKAFIKLDISYLNSASSRAISEIFEMLESAKLHGALLDIIWFYDDDNELSKEMGDDFAEEFPKLAITLTQK
ncbi:MAG TPA: DUF1987 domain-containing protein [Campylobacterales bacterium]|nr:DUF1987 domain-containing protein [Campylobacterales bacterium]